VADLQGKVDQAPRREQDLVALSRDYDNLKKMYDDLLTKKANAKISEEAELRQRGDRFQILDPANFPEEPFKPKKLRLFLLGFLAASGLGFGAAFGLEWMDPTLRSASDFRHFFNLKVLASIPDLGDGAGVLRAYVGEPSWGGSSFSWRVSQALSGCTGNGSERC